MNIRLAPSDSLRVSFAVLTAIVVFAIAAAAHDIARQVSWAKHSALEIPGLMRAGITSADIERLETSVAGVETALRGGLSLAGQPAPDDPGDRFVQARTVSESSLRDLRAGVERIKALSAPRAGKPRNLSFFLVEILTIIAGTATLFLLKRMEFARKGRSEAEARADYLAHHDLATGLYNAFVFEELLLARVGKQASVAVLDLEGFALMNDRRGRAFGDAVLREIAWRLQKIARDTGGDAARLGGSRFALLVPFDEISSLREFCASAIATCDQPIMIGVQTVTPKVNLGVLPLSRISASDPRDCDAIFRLAGFALADGKTSPMQYSVYDGSLGEIAIHDLTLINALPRALHDQTIDILFQPRLPLDGEGIIGFEAMVRWRHDGVEVPIPQILELAEESGLATDLGCYVLDQAVGIVAEWNRRRKTRFPISVNLSIAHFRTAEGVAFVADVLKKHAYPAELLTLEIDETLRFDRDAGAIRQFEALQSMGCRLSIDDFGIGLTSFAILNSLEADEIKIDRSLVEELEQNEAARLVFDAAMRMATSLGTSVIVESAKNEMPVDLLQMLERTKVQGYCVGKPLPANEWLAEVTYGSSGGTAA